jgi:hypothetical protein
MKARKISTRTVQLVWLVIQKNCHTFSKNKQQLQQPHRIRQLTQQSLKRIRTIRLRHKPIQIAIATSTAHPIIVHQILHILVITQTATKVNKKKLKPTRLRQHSIVTCPIYHLHIPQKQPQTANRATLVIATQPETC